ncbi:MAG: OmpA family protein [Gemmatimonadaceae bacterium]|nr:OmpA family protein [Gemmatimonadaceae bacterium]
MSNRSLLVVAVAAVALSAAACQKQPEVAPVPAVNTDSINAANERARLEAERIARERAEADRIARERAEADRIARDKAEAEARARAAMAAARAAFATAIYFDLDKSELTSEARAALDAKLPLLRANPNVRIRVAGHADDRGSDEYNVALSQRRAAAAKRYLVDQGIPADRIDVAGFGEERPAMQGSGEDVWSKNRRDEFEIIVGGETLRLP